MMTDARTTTTLILALCGGCHEYGLAPIVVPETDEPAVDTGEVEPPVEEDDSDEPVGETAEEEPDTADDPLPGFVEVCFHMDDASSMDDHGAELWLIETDHFAYVRWQPQPAAVGATTPGVICASAPRGSYIMNGVDGKSSLPWYCINDGGYRFEVKGFVSIDGFRVDSYPIRNDGSWGTHPTPDVGCDIRFVTP